jgi:hypothetical protein
MSPWHFASLGALTRTLVRWLGRDLLILGSSGFGTFATCRQTLEMSAPGGIAEAGLRGRSGPFLTQSGHQPQRQHRALVSRPPRQNRWSLQQLDSPRNRNVVSNVAKEEEMRYRQNRAAFPLEAHSAPPALRAGRMDRSGRPEGDNDIVEQYRNPSKVRAP